MYIDGYCVDSLDSFRMHFSLLALLEYLDQPVIFKKWMQVLPNSGGMDESVCAHLRNLDTAFSCWCSEVENPEIESLDCFTSKFSENSRFFQEFLDHFPIKNSPFLLNGCYILHLLLEIAEQTVGDEEAAAVSSFFLSKTDSLWICVHSDGPPVLHRGSREIEALPVPEDLPQFETLISAAQDADTGFLGIARDGSLINGSALWVPTPEKKVVKVLLSQNLYALLLEDGTVQHNLKWSPPLPRSENIFLQNGRLTAVPF